MEMRRLLCPDIYGGTHFSMASLPRERCGTTSSFESVWFRTPRRVLEASRKKTVLDRPMYQSKELRDMVQRDGRLYLSAAQPLDQFLSAHHPRR